MCSRNILTVRFIFFGVFLFLAAPCCFAQSNHLEIEIYRSLIDKEACDSSYHKAFTQYHTSPIPAIPTVSSALQKQLIAILSLPENTDTEVSKKTEALEALAQEAAHKRDPCTELSALSEAFIITFWHEPKHYNKAFVLAVKLKKRLGEVDDTQFPSRRDTYVKLGEAYYIFKDYAKSIELLANVIDKPPLSFGDRSRLEALRISGICYANIQGGMQQSDSCFMAMILCPDMVLDRPVYDALALSNLGCNAMMQGDFNKALALDLEVLPRLKQERDYGHIAGMYACQGFCYLGKGDYTNLRMVIDSISTYAHKDYYNLNKRLKQAYTLSGKYYSAMGDVQRAQLYNDSLVALYKAEEQEYTSQFISDARREVRDQEIVHQRQEITHQRNLMVFVLVILAIISIGTMIIAHLYRKRNAAYKVLAQKAEMWAREVKKIELSLHTGHGQKDVINELADNNPVGIGKNGTNDYPTDEDHRIMALIEYEMTIEYAYREMELTAEVLSSRLGVHRNAISHAVNRITGGNFKNYINGYRIKEAVRIISEIDRSKLYIEQVYEQVGFGNRNSFYRTFKQFTGLSPVEFQKTKDIHTQ